jgi:hypothetical protein
MKNNPRLSPAAEMLVSAFKRSAKADFKTGDGTHPLAWYLDVRGRALGFANWALFHLHIAHLPADDLDALLARSKGKPDLAHFGKAAPSVTAIDEADEPEDVMRAYVRDHYTPLQDFAFYDNESESGYAWPDVELAEVLQEEFSDRYPLEMILEVARYMEAESGPWGVEEYGRNDD